HLVLYGGTLLALGSIVFGFAAEAVRRGVPLGTVRPPAGMWVTTAGAIWFFASAPFDDLWHRLYGIDVTIWSPPHLSLIAAACTVVFGSVVIVLGERRRREARGLAGSGQGRVE